MTASTFNTHDDDDLDVRPATPPWVPEVDRSIGDEGLPEWHADGLDPEIRLLGAFILGAGSLALLLVLLMALLSTPANRSGVPAPRPGAAVPTTYGPPPTANP